jgi:peptidoglycan hydrolase-like protein with peptidoglycan-binding domain
MADRGWSITPDGLYGDQTRNVALAFQREKGLTPDGLIGPATWSAAWTAPVT